MKQSGPEGGPACRPQRRVDNERSSPGRDRRGHGSRCRSSRGRSADRETASEPMARDARQIGGSERTCRTPAIRPAPARRRRAGRTATARCPIRSAGWCETPPRRTKTGASCRGVPAIAPDQKRPLSQLGAEARHPGRGAGQHRPCAVDADDHVPVAQQRDHETPGPAAEIEHRPAALAGQRAVEADVVASAAILPVVEKRVVERALHRGIVPPIGGGSVRNGRGGPDGQSWAGRRRLTRWRRLREFGRPMDAIVLLSGGIDSATALAMTRAAGHRCPRSFRFGYGQPSRRRAGGGRAGGPSPRRYPATTWHDPRPARDRRLGPHRPRSPLPKGRDEAAIGSGIPVTYVPARNTVLLASRSRGRVLGAKDRRRRQRARRQRLSRLPAGVHRGVRGARPGRHARRERRRVTSTRRYRVGKADIIRLDELGSTTARPTPATTRWRARACGRCDRARCAARVSRKPASPDPTRYA